MLLLHHLWEVEAQPAGVLLGQRGNDQPGVARVVPKLLVDGVDGGLRADSRRHQVDSCLGNASRPLACRCSAASCSVAVSVFHRSRCRTGLAGTSRTNSAVSSCFAISLSFSTSLGLLTDSCATTR